MSSLWRLFKKSAPSTADPISVRGQLFDAAQRGDEQALLSLCRTNQKLIQQSFSGWTNIRAYDGVDATDAKQVQFIINGLGRTAEAFRDKLGDASLWNLLAGPSDSNPFAQFEKALEQAKKLTADMNYREAVDLLTSYLIEIKDLQGPGADKFRSYGHGMIGLALFHSNHPADAISHFQRALSLCEVQGDQEGVGVYQRHLWDAHRYFGQPLEAAGYADRLAAFYKDGADAELWRARGVSLRAGEPLLRMVAERDGRVSELSNLSTMEGATKFLFERNRPTLAPAFLLCRKGNDLASQSKYDEALSFFRDAAKADPYDPASHYQAGITLLLLQRYPEAIDEYEKVNTLAPGWFNVGNDLWVAQELLAERLSHEAFLAAWALEHTAMEPPKKLKLIDQAIASFPKFANLHLLRASTLQALNQEGAAIAAIDNGLATDPEPDIRSRLLAQRAIMSGPAEHQRLFSEVLNIPGADLMSRTIAQVMLKSEAKPE